KVLVSIANEMAARGWKVGFVCPDYAHIPGFPLHPGIQVRAVATGNRSLPKVFKKILFYLKLSLYDFSSAKFCLANYFPTALCAFTAKLARFSRVTIVWYVQGFEAKSHGLLAQANPLSRIFRCFLAHLSYRIPIPVLCVSRWVRTSIGRPDGTVVYPPAIDLAVFSPEKKESANSSCMIIGTVGRGGGTKGYDYFLKAIENLECSLKIKILIVSPDKKGIVVPGKFPAELIEGSNERVMADFYNRCDVFVLSSLAEGFPLPVLEAMACGCPVITTACGGVSDYAEDGVNCLVVPPAQPGAMSEAIFRLYDNPGLRKKLSSAAQGTVKNFGKGKLLDDFIGAIVRSA
ncbi:MAG: glycosyltransferase family 4 protein, partial [Candidatus Omnitrophica bacterium]|nr:glycosyltransferase family 4 protein [Candidatus Omnitrophota bacterium]